MYGLNTQHSLKMVLKKIIEDDYTFALLTGDIAQEESVESYHILKQCLDVFPKPVYMLPGNHDDFTAMSTILNDDIVSCRKQIVEGNWQVIMLNSQQEGEVGGFLSDYELSWLEQCLSCNADHYSLVCVHHHPVKMGSKWLDSIGLDNSDALFEILAAYSQVKGVLWGHVHQEYDEVRAGVRLISCPSTCIQFKPGVNQFELDLIPPGFRWLELYDDGGIKTGITRLDEIPGTIDQSAKGYNESDHG